MDIRKASQQEVSMIMELVKKAVADMISKGIEQWDDIYPNIEVISRDIAEGNLYVYHDGVIKGIVVLNEYQDKEYEEVQWEKQCGKPMVIHRLCIAPQSQGSGIARAFIDFAEEYAKRNEYDSIRLDTFIHNLRACRLYEGKGYKKVGIVTFRKGEFYCYEKNIV
ncbi:MAG: GNAT family N-acetyltransferase [Bacillota bacterium]|nr:GNAT family N-acetyltransferase [Bacillota bacterium]